MPGVRNCNWYMYGANPSRLDELILSSVFEDIFSLVLILTGVFGEIFIMELILTGVYGEIYVMELIRLVCLGRYLVLC